jgi:hypothetical protein
MEATRGAERNVELRKSGNGKRMDALPEEIDR